MLLLSFIPFLLPIIYVAVLIFVILDIIRSDFKDSTTKIIFILIVLLLPTLGMLIYMIYRKKWGMLFGLIMLMIILMSAYTYSIYISRSTVE